MCNHYQTSISTDQLTDSIDESFVRRFPYEALDEGLASETKDNISAKKKTTVTKKKMSRLGWLSSDRRINSVLTSVCAPSAPDLP